MFQNPAYYKRLQFLAIPVLLISILLGFSLGRILAIKKYIDDYVPLMTDNSPLPSRILDVNNNLITEISEGSRELLAQKELSRNLIYALMAREDSTFFEHNGFSLWGTARAFTYIVLNKLIGTPTAGGGSTLTQQLAGALKADRTDISLNRKLIELWWAFIFENHYSKQEILVNYLNSVYFGDRNYGIEAASRFLFGKSAKDISIAEASLAVIQLARPNGDFSPLRHPNQAKLRQRAVLDKAVELDLMTASQVQDAFQQYWDNFDLTRSDRRSTQRKDEAPYFTDYVQRVLERVMYGHMTLTQAGFTVYTTLDLAKQKEVEEIVQDELKTIDRLYNSQNVDLISILEKQELPELARLANIFGFRNLNLSGGREKRRAQVELQKENAATLEVMLVSLGMTQGYDLLKKSAERLDKFQARETPEMAVMTMDNRSGDIVSMIGGRSYNINEARLFNRTVDSRVLPGSAIKPLFYAAAIHDRKITPATPLPDGPYQFINPDGTPYVPSNYHTNYRGIILARQALAISLNIPAIHVLDMVGFEDGVKMATQMLGITDPRLIRTNFPYVYPIALGTSPVSPMSMLRAYSTFSHQGIPLDANVIRYVEDRNGQVVYNFNRQAQQAAADESRRLLSKSEAYIMTNMMVSTVTQGTLYNVKARYDRDFDTKFEIPIAAKTGTTQNWSDGWTIGYSPRYTTVVWVGFDQPGNSLGESLYGARAAGPTFLRVMQLMHRGIDPKTLSFERPDDIVSVNIDKRNGYRWVPACGAENRRAEVFLPGTVPTLDCTQAPRDNVFNQNLSDLNIFQDQDRPTSDIELYNPDQFDFLNDAPFPEPAGNSNSNLDNSAGSSPEPSTSETSETSETIPSAEDNFNRASRELDEILKNNG